MVENANVFASSNAAVSPLAAVGAVLPPSSAGLTGVTGVLDGHVPLLYSTTSIRIDYASFGLH